MVRPRFMTFRELNNDIPDGFLARVYPYLLRHLSIEEPNDVSCADVSLQIS